MVTGVLQKDGRIDVHRTRLLVQAAGPMEVSFHKAFDRSADPLQALEDVIATGCTRLLTSGQKQHAVDGKYLIKELIIKAANRIIIMPGGGIRSNNIIEIAQLTGAAELHSGARKFYPPATNTDANNWEDDPRNIGADEAEISRMKSILLK